MTEFGFHLFDIFGYEPSDKIRRIVDCASDDERRIAAVVEYGTDDLEVVYRKLTLEQFFECFGSARDKYNCRITSVRWQAPGFPGIEFDFNYMRAYSRRSANSIRSIDWAIDLTGFGSITFYPGEYDDRLLQVFVNFAADIMGRIDTRRNDRQVKDYAMQLLKRAKSILSPETERI